MNKTKTITLTGLLTALAIIIPMIMPLKVVMPPFTATLASHVPLILAMFISPLSAVVVALGSGIGFLLTPLGPIVAARAALHVVFTFFGAYMIRKNFNFYLVLLVTLLLHALSDMAIVYVLSSWFNINVIGDQAMGYVQYVIGIGTSIHHVVDYAIAVAIAIPLTKAMPGVINENGLKLSGKATGTPSM